MLADSQWSALGSRLSTLERHLKVCPEWELHSLQLLPAYVLSKHQVWACKTASRHVCGGQAFTRLGAHAAATDHQVCSHNGYGGDHDGEDWTGAWQELAADNTSTPPEGQSSILRLTEDVEAQLASQGALLTQLSGQVP